MHPAISKIVQIRNVLGSLQLNEVFRARNLREAFGPGTTTHDVELSNWR